MNGVTLNRKETKNIRGHNDRKTADMDTKVRQQSANEIETSHPAGLSTVKQTNKQTKQGRRK